MSVTIFLLIGIAVLATCLICRACSGPASRETNAATRRVSALADRRVPPTGQPGEATTGNVETLLRRRGISASDALLVTTRARALGMKPATMQLAVHRYGARELAIAVAGDLSHEALLAHLVEGSAPDFEHLALFAALNGLDAAQVPVRAGRDSSGPAAHIEETPQADRHQAFAGLDIHEPGSWPFGPRAA